MPSEKLRIPLAWLQLSWDKLRLCAALSGIVFAVALMLIQLGFSDALYLAAVQIHERLHGDLVMLSSQYEYLLGAKSYSERYLYQTLSFPEVTSVAPVYVGLGNWKNQETHRELPIFVMGFDPRLDVFTIPEIKAGLDQLRLPDVVFFDEGSKPEYGSYRAALAAGRRDTTEVSGHRVVVGGDFTLGISFASDGNLITSDQNFLRIMPGRQLGVINLGLIRLKPGADPEAVRRKIVATLPVGIQVMTHAQFVSYEQNYWAKRTPIGFIFNMGTFVGFLVGAVIVYQILYTDVSDHLKEYATLKAMGYNDRFLFGVVMREGLILALVGFVPGWLFSSGMSVLTRKVTLLPSYMTLERSVIVLSLTIFMCVGSGMLAMRKLRAADPADNF
jgi:putative ABC transport system permease protein